MSAVAAGCTFTAGGRVSCWVLRAVPLGSAADTGIPQPGPLPTQQGEPGRGDRKTLCEGFLWATAWPSGRRVLTSRRLNIWTEAVSAAASPTLKYLVSRVPPHQVPGGLTCLHPSTQHSLTHSCTCLLTQFTSMCGAMPHESSMALSEELVFVLCKQP